MRENPWHDVWGRRVVDANADLTLDFLIKADGFDQGIGDIEAERWTSECLQYADWMELKKNMSMFEFGCGAGAFLKPFYDALDICVSGIDLSPALVNIAKKVMPLGEFNVGRIEDFQPVGGYDVVVANSVIHYLKKNDINTFLCKAMKTSKNFILISDIPNFYKMRETESYRKRLMVDKGIEKKYKNLCHTYFKPEELVGFF